MFDSVKLFFFFLSPTSNFFATNAALHDNIMQATSSQILASQILKTRESLVGCSKSTPLQCVKLKLLPNNFCGVVFMDGTLEAMTLSHFCLRLLYFELRVAVSSAGDILLAYF